MALFRRIPNPHSYQQEQREHAAAAYCLGNDINMQGSLQYFLLSHQEANGRTNLKQRTQKQKLETNVAGAGSSTADVQILSQEHQRVNHRNEYTTTTKTTTTKATTRSTQTTNQHNKEKKEKPTKLRQQRHVDSSNSFSLGKNRSRLAAKIWTSSWRWNAFQSYLDSTFCTMLTMFVVVIIVISGNTVLGAQRDSFRVKDTKGLSNNANAIPNGAGSVGNGNGNAVNSNGADTNTISSGNGVGNAPAGTTNSTSSFMNPNQNHNPNHNQNQSQKQNQNQSENENETQATITATTVTTTTTSTSAASKLGSSLGSGNAIASGSLQKANSLGSNVQTGNTGINRNAIETLDETRSGPYFDKAASKNVTALLGKTAYLNCRVKNLGNKTMLLQVSWVRHRDIHLLTVGRYTYTSDQRFRAIHQPQTEDWILQIKYPQHRDSGIYECQVSTTPHMSHYIHLNVVEPSTEIIGAPDLYIESGSTINLTCVILNSPEPPAYIFWNHNNAIINYDSPRGGVSVVTNKGETTTSFLLIKSARQTDSGLYQCNPSNAKPKSVTVHVLNGEFPAAMQRAGQAHHRMSPSHYLLVYLSLYLFTLAYVGRFMKLSPPLRQSQPPKLSSSIKIVGTAPSAPPAPYKMESSQAVRCPLV